MEGERKAFFKQNMFILITSINDLNLMKMRHIISFVFWYHLSGRVLVNIKINHINSNLFLHVECLFWMCRIIYICYTQLFPINSLWLFCNDNTKVNSEHAMDIWYVPGTMLWVWHYLFLISLYFLIKNKPRRRDYCICRITEQKFEVGN